MTEIQRKLYTPWYSPERVTPEVIGRLCRKCGHKWPEDQFYSDDGKPRSTCKTCRAKAKIHWKNRPK